jgi:hypothetical protein
MFTHSELDPRLGLRQSSRCYSLPSAPPPGSSIRHLRIQSHGLESGYNDLRDAVGAVHGLDGICSVDYGIPALVGRV